jgi:putative SOS response-associated peptidase YedK
MMWGLVPYWFKGSSAKDHGLTTNNARLERLKESRLYRHALEHDKRCVVVCDGEHGSPVLKTKPCPRTGKEPPT